MTAFINTRDGNVYHRTQLFRSFGRANAFSKMVSANSRFQNASVIESSRADNGWYVQYQPSNPARYADLYYAQYRQRELKGQTEGKRYTWDLQQRGGRVWYLCASTSGETYEVTECSCTCPDWTFRGRKSGLPCGHLHAYNSAVASGDILAIAEVKMRAARVVTVAVAVTAANSLQARFAARGLDVNADFGA